MVNSTVPVPLMRDLVKSFLKIQVGFFVVIHRKFAESLLRALSCFSVFPERLFSFIKISPFTSHYEAGVASDFEYLR